MKKGLMIVCVLFVLVIIGLSAVFDQTIAASKQLTFTPISLIEIADGTYTGTASAGIVKAEVQVTVKDHRLFQIEILHHEQGMGKEAEHIVQDMIKQNTVEVDVIAGATVSSRVLRKAIENALSKPTEYKKI